MAKLNFQNIASSNQVKNYNKPGAWVEFREYILYFIEVLFAVTLAFIFIRYFLFDLLAINGKSMYPTYNNYPDKTTKDNIYVDLLSHRFSDYRRGDVVFFIPPRSCEPTPKFYIKRVIALPGETVVIENGKVYIKTPEFNNKLVLLDESAYLPSYVKTFKNINLAGPKFEEKTLEQDEYYLMGDNRTASFDSRKCGAIAKDSIFGKELYRNTPAEKAGFFELPKYNIPNII